MVRVALRNLPVWTQIAASTVLRAQTKDSALEVGNDGALLAKVVLPLSVKPKEGILPINSSPHLSSLFEMSVAVCRLP